MQNHIVSPARQKVRDQLNEREFDKFNWNGLGTLHGFADDMFGRGVVLDIDRVMRLLDEYRTECAKYGTSEVDLQMATYADSVEQVIQDRTAERYQLADFILSIKSSLDGATLWPLVAKLATSADPICQIRHVTQDHCRAMLQVLDGLKQFEVSFQDSLNPDYRPGADTRRDQSMLMNITCFDLTLREEEPWDCGEPDWFEEAGVLLALAEHAGVREALASRLSAGNATETTAHAA